MRILINAISAKKKTGGAFQISLNFIKETINHSDVEWFYLISKDLEEDIKRLSLRAETLYVLPTQPSRSLEYFKVAHQVRNIERQIKPGLVYTLCSPSYMRFEGIEVMRFNNAWITNPNPYAWQCLPIKNRVKMHLYRAIQKFYLRKCNYFITQTEVVGEGIIRITGVPKTNVRVISNVLPKVYSSYDRNTPRENKDEINIMCVATDIRHKNLDIIPDVITRLVNEYGITSIRFHLTLPNDSALFIRISEALKEKQLSNYLINHGHCSQDQLATLYLHSDYCFIPSLLETMSASIIEALYFKLPMVLPDLPFNTTVLGDAGVYYTPKDSVSAADGFARLILDPSLNKVLLDKMERILPRFRDYTHHFNETVTFFKDILTQNLLSVNNESD